MHNEHFLPQLGNATLFNSYALPNENPVEVQMMFSSRKRHFCMKMIADGLTSAILFTVHSVLRNAEPTRTGSESMMASATKVIGEVPLLHS